MSDLLARIQASYARGRGAWLMGVPAALAIGGSMVLHFVFGFWQ